MCNEHGSGEEEGKSDVSAAKDCGSNSQGFCFGKFWCCFCGCDSCGSDWFSVLVGDEEAGKDSFVCLEGCKRDHVFAVPDGVHVVEGEDDKEQECEGDVEDGNEDGCKSAVDKEFADVVQDEVGFEYFERGKD